MDFFRKMTGTILKGAAVAILGMAITTTAKAEEGFMTADNGLKHKITKEGSGDPAKPGQEVTVHYTGWLYENGKKGQEFDSSHSRNQPFSFQLGVGRVIQGWDEGVAGMKPGEQRTLIVPPDLAYGERAMGNVIKPNSTLMFDVELISAEGEAFPPPKKIDAKKFTKTDTGLLYKDEATGEGKEAEMGHEATVHYTGWLYEDGMRTKQFDTSRNRNQPFTFPIGGGRVIKGWDQGVAGMKPGGKRQLIIPPDLAYGNQARGGVIVPNSTLYFEIALLELGGEPFAKLDTKGYKTAENGLKYEVLTEGDGPQPTAGQTVSVHYTGWLYEDGMKKSKFDSSRDRGQVFEFPLGQGRVIKGWDQGVAMMQIGSKYNFLIPPELAYGERGAGRAIGPNSTLLFEVELLDIK